MINKNVMGIIFCNTNDSYLNELTSIRAIGSVPFGGRYRLIDFSLSAFVNSGISKVGLVTKENFKSLADHIGSGRPWDLARKNGGLFMLSPYSSTNAVVYKGKIDALNGALDYLERSNEEYVALSNSNVVTSFSIEDMVDNHIESGADITVAYKKNIKTSSYIKIKDGLATGFKSDAPVKDKNSYLETFVISKELLISLVKEAMTHNYTDFTADIFDRKANKLKINCFEVKTYAKMINCVQDFFDANMDLLDKDIRKAIFDSENPVYTKLRDEMPTKYGFDSKVENSLIAEGCVIEGEVKNSIIFRGVKIGKGARVENCIIMQSGIIGNNTQLDHVVADKNVEFKEGRTLMGCRSFPMVIGKGLTV
ncbi:MAG: glucose-1-phosphate adenylyltransferase subunit GlgD [Acutalibacteraceae bacterium]